MPPIVNQNAYQNIQNTTLSEAEDLFISASTSQLQFLIEESKADREKGSLIDKEL